MNELRLTYTRVRDKRGHAFGQEPFPAVTVDARDGDDRGRRHRELLGARNELDQDIIEINDA